jgi:hypothetical protein
VVAALAAGGGADVAVELGRRPEIQRGLEHCRVPAAEVGDGVDLGARVQYGLEEGITAELFGQRDGDRPAPEDVARLAFMGVAPPVGLEVADDHEIGAVGLALPSAVLDHPCEGLCRECRSADFHLGGAA